MSKRRLVLFAALVGLFATECSSRPVEDTPAVTRLAQVEQGLPQPELGTLAWSLPSFADPARVPLVALGELKINDRARVLTAGLTMGEVVSLGATTTNLGVEATVGDLTSIPNVWLRDRSVVSGNVVTNGSITEQNLVTVLGTRRQQSNLVGGSVALSLAFAAATNDARGVSSLAPGRYDEVAVQDRDMTLTEGVYRLNSLYVQTGRKLLIDSSRGPVVVLVANGIGIAGSVEAVGGGFPEWVVGFTGTWIGVGRELNGTFIAPNATVNLSVGEVRHEGTIVAKNIELHQGSTFVHRPFPEGIARFRKLFGLPGIAAGDCPFSVPSLAIGRNGDISDTSRVLTYAGFNHVREIKGADVRFPGTDDSVMLDRTEVVSMTFGDFDGDGKDELAAGLSGDSAAQRPRMLTFHDLDVNGFGPVRTTLLDFWDRHFNVLALASGDVDGDGADEIAIGRDAASNNGKEFFIMEDAAHAHGIRYEDDISDCSVRAITIGDADGDPTHENPEILVARDAGNLEGTSGRVVVYRFDPALNIFRRGEFGFGWGDTRGATAVAIGNLDGNVQGGERPEIAVGRNSGPNDRVLVYRWNATARTYDGVATIDETVLPDNSRTITGVDFADLDGDGDDELVVGRSGCNTLGCDGGARLFVFDGPIVGGKLTQRFTAGSDWGAERAVRSLVTGDIDDDGRDEIVVGRTAGDGARVIIYDDATAGFGVMKNIGGVWGSSRAARSLAISKSRFCESRPPSPLPQTVEESKQLFPLRRANVIRSWLKSFMPRLVAGQSAAEVFGSWVNEPHNALRFILAGAAAIRLDLPERRTLLQHGFVEKMNEYLAGFVHMNKDVGTDGGGVHGDFDFAMMELLEVLYYLESAPHPTQQGAFMLSDAAIREMLLTTTYSEVENLDLPVLEAWLDDFLPGPTKPNFPVVPYASPEPQKVFADVLEGIPVPLIEINVPETENHVLMVNTWAYLASQWLFNEATGSPRRGAPVGVFPFPPFFRVADSELEQFLLAAIGRFVQNGSWETNARPYQAFSIRALQILHSYADNPIVKKAAQNALDTLATKFAFQSLYGKRMAPMRRNWERRYDIGVHQNDYVGRLFGVLSGASVVDTDPDCSGIKCAYSDMSAGQSAGFTLDSALLGYAIPDLVVDFMLRPDNHREGFGAWARLQDRYSEDHYAWFVPGRYPMPNPLDQPNLNQQIAANELPIEPQAEFYFLTRDYMNTAGGRGERYTGMEPLPADLPLLDDFDVAKVKFGTDWVSKPTALIGHLDVGYWSENDGIAQETLAISGGNEDPAYSDNRGVYKNVAFGAGSLRIPKHWTTAATGALGAATFSVVDRTTTRSALSSSEYYLVVATLPPSWGLWEVVPRRLFATEQALLANVLGANAGNSMDAIAGYVYTTSVSGEKLALSKSVPADPPFLSIDGSTFHAAAVHQHSPAALMPLMDVRQVDDSYRFTGVSYVCASGGRVVVNNPHLRRWLRIDSSSHLSPQRSESSNVAPSPDPCTSGFPNGAPPGQGGAGGAGGASGAAGLGGSGGFGGSGVGGFSASLVVDSAWSEGYCATIRVTNATSRPTTTYSVTLNMNGTTLRPDAWNGTFSGSTGVVTVVPFAYHQIVAPGAVDTHMGFCGSRPAGSPLLPSVTSATPTF